MMAWMARHLLVVMALVVALEGQQALPVAEMEENPREELVGELLAAMGAKAVREVLPMVAMEATEEMLVILTI